MKVTKIHSKNAAYQKLEVLSTNRNKRYKYYEFLVEGVRNINEAIKNGWEIVSLIYAPSLPMSDWAKGVIKSTRTTEGNIELDAPLMQDLSGKEDTSELMAVVKMRPDDPDQIKFRGVPLLALFDRPSNKGNLGTIIRTLDAMGARLELEAAVGAVTADDEGHFLIAAQPRLVEVDDLELVASALGVHAVHPVQIIGEQRAFLTARTAADLDDDVAFIVRILGKKEDLELLFQLRQSALRVIELDGRKLPEFFIGRRVVEDHQAVLDGLLSALVFAVLFDHRFDGRVFAHHLAVAVGVGHHVRLIHPLFQFVISFIKYR